MALYQGREVTLNKPRKIPGVTPKDKKKTVYVRDPSTGKIKRIHFGAAGYGHNYSADARKSFLARMKGVKNAQGQPAWKDKTSPAYWAVRALWGGPSAPKASNPR
jgi:hypothetical protein